MEQEKFSLIKRIKSFEYAFSGLVLIFKTDHNVWLHFIATLLVIVLGFVMKVTLVEAALLTVAVGLVWVTELFNTCLEKMMDFVSKERNPDIKFIKDVSAGAVLVASITALVLGCIVFIPKIWYL
jgi:diacylglycerol kinase (ATP)